MRTAPRPTLFSRNYVLVCAATFAFFASQMMLIPIFPDFLRERSGASNATIGLFIGLFSVTGVLLRPSVGRSLEHRARGTYMIAGGAIAGVAALGYWIAPGMASLVPIRLFHGISVACYYVAASTLVADLSPVERRGEAISYFSMMLYLGLATGPALGLALDRAAGFPAVFAISAGLGAACALVAALVREPPPVEHAPGAARRALISREALFPGAVLALAAVAYSAAMNFTADMARQTGIPGRAFYFPVLALSVIGARFFAGSLSDRVGRVAVAAPGLALFALAMAIEAAATTTSALLASAVAFGIGFGVFFPTAMALTIDRVPVSARGVALGTFTGAFDLGFGLGSLVMGAIAGAAGYPAMYRAAALFVAAGLVLLWMGAWVGERRAAHA